MAGFKPAKKGILSPVYLTLDISTAWLFNYLR